jgi:hypothetical protein
MHRHLTNDKRERSVLVIGSRTQRSEQRAATGEMNGPDVQKIHAQKRLHTAQTNQAGSRSHGNGRALEDITPVSNDGVERPDWPGWHETTLTVLQVYLKRPCQEGTQLTICRVEELVQHRRPASRCVHESLWQRCNQRAPGSQRHSRGGAGEKWYLELRPGQIHQLETSRPLREQELYLAGRPGLEESDAARQ